MEKTEGKKALVEDLGNYIKSLNVKKLYEESDHRDSKDWLAEVAAVLKNLDEPSSKVFLDLRRHLYPSIRYETRKHAAEQIDGFVRQKLAEFRKVDFEPPKQPTTYIRQEMIEGFIGKKDGFGYKKLIRLLGELNSNYAAGHPYASSMLLRAVLDHIPPLLGCRSFEEVSSSYVWPVKADKEYMEKLRDFRKEADDALHRPISKDQDLLELENLPPSNRVNRLLQECLSVSGSAGKPVPSGESQHLQSEGIQFKLASRIVSWANYSLHTPRAVWPSFRMELEIDNFKSNKPNYISVSMEANLISGEKWLGKHFVFYTVDKQDEAFRIEGTEVKRVTVFVSDIPVGSLTQMPMPEIDKKTLRIDISTRSGIEYSIPLSEDQVTRG